MPHTEHRGPDGKKWPSVTEFLGAVAKPGLFYFYAKEGWQGANDIGASAREFGSAVHAGIEAAILGEPEPKLTSRQRELVTRALTWMKESGFVVKAQEQHVKHEALGYAGTFDLLGYFESMPETLFIVDWKCSSSVNKDYGLQLAAYAAAYNAQNGLTWETGVNHGGIIRLEKKPAKSPQVEAKTFAPLEELMPYVEAALTLYQGGYGKASAEASEMVAGLKDELGSGIMYVEALEQELIKAKRK